MGLSKELDLAQIVRGTQAEFDKFMHPELTVERRMGLKEVLRRRAMGVEVRPMVGTSGVRIIPLYWFNEEPRELDSGFHRQGRSCQTSAEIYLRIALEEEFATNVLRPIAHELAPVLAVVKSQGRFFGMASDLNVPEPCYFVATDIDPSPEASWWQVRAKMKFPLNDRDSCLAGCECTMHGDVIGRCTFEEATRLVTVLAADNSPVVEFFIERQPRPLHMQ